MGVAHWPSLLADYKQWRKCPNVRVCCPHMAHGSRWTQNTQSRLPEVLTRGDHTACCRGARPDNSVCPRFVSPCVLVHSVPTPLGAAPCTATSGLRTQTVEVCRGLLSVRTNINYLCCERRIALTRVGEGRSVCGGAGERDFCFIYIHWSSTTLP